jgi:hypothetical protein
MRKGSKTLHKDKSTEVCKYYCDRCSRPDAFKYLIYRRDYVDMVNNHSSYTEWIL